MFLVGILKKKCCSIDSVVLVDYSLSRHDESVLDFRRSYMHFSIDGVVELKKSVLDFCCAKAL